jgi:hypothetical protein
VIPSYAGQPLLLGKDAMFTFGMDLLLSDNKFTVNPSKKQTTVQFKFVDYDILLKQFNVTKSDLRPIIELPSIAESVQKVSDVGTSHTMIDMGVTY